MHIRSGHNNSLVVPCSAAFRVEIAGKVNRVWGDLEVPWNAPCQSTSRGVVDSVLHIMDKKNWGRVEVLITLWEIYHIVGAHDFPGYDFR